MSPDEDALLNGIAADPAADLPRLVYADWLEEHGQDMRAEFIRVQCEIAKLEVGPRDAIDRNVHLWRRQQELLDGHMDAIFEGVGFVPRHGQIPGPRFYRGFVSEIDMTLSDFIKHKEEIIELRPAPTELAVTTSGHYEEMLRGVGIRFWRLVTVLSFLGDDADTSVTDVGPDEAKLWHRLHTLIALNGTIPCHVLVTNFGLDAPALRTLNINNSMFTDLDTINLLNAGVLQRLSHISLIENAIGDQAAIEMADRLGNSPNLKELDLRRNGITTVGQAALLARLGSKVILF